MRMGLTRSACFLLGLVMPAVAGIVRAGEETARRSRYSPFPRVARVDEGIVWKRGQALPAFAMPAATLDSIEVQALSPDERITFSALQGLVNSKKPRIYLLDGRADQGRDTWARISTVGFDRETDTIERTSTIWSRSTLAKSRASCFTTRV